MSPHLKRLAAPRSWRIARKTHVWTVAPSPGPHPIERSVPLLIAIRDILNYCDTYKEARRIIGNREILVDGKVRRNYKYPIGLMDVMTIPKLNISYRVLIDSKGKITFVKIPQEQSGWKLVRIEDKTTVRDGKVQLNFHDGRNLLLAENKYKTGDVLKLAIPAQKILASYPLAPGNVAMIIGGKHIGQVAPIVEYKITRSPHPNIVRFDKFETIKSYVFVVGKDKPEIPLPEISVISS